MSTPELTPSGHPILQGRQQISRNWALTLPFAMARRVEDGSLVFWAPGGRLTIWLSIWGREADDAAFDRAARWAVILDDASPDAFAPRQDRDGSIWRYSYRLREAADDARVPAFYGYAVGAEDHILLAAYFDDEGTAAIAEQVYASLDEPPV